MNKDFLSLVFSFVHTDAIGAALTLMLIMSWEVYSKGRYDLLPYFLAGVLAMLVCKSLLKADKTQKRETKLADKTGEPLSSGVEELHDDNEI